MRSCDTCSPCLADCKPSLHGRRINYRQLVVFKTFLSEGEDAAATAAAAAPSRHRVTPRSEVAAAPAGPPGSAAPGGPPGRHKQTEGNMQWFVANLFKYFLNMYFFWSEIQLYKNCESCFVNLKNPACLVAYRYSSWEKMQKKNKTL